MGFVRKLMGKDGAPAGTDAAGGNATGANGTGGNAAGRNVDGAIDTLCCVLHTLGDVSFTIDDGERPEDFKGLCDALARHVGNGGDVPQLGIGQSVSGVRQWAHVRRFYIDRRQREKEYVGGSMRDYRGMVDELIGGLRELGQRDTDTADSVRQNLKRIDDAVLAGSLPEIRATLTEALQNVADSFAEQKQAYERRIGEMNERMNSLRQNLTAAREEMKRDTLTGAYNRGAFDTAIAQSLNLSFILKQPVTVVFIDLDFFKNINDNWGHAAGDRVLRSVSDCLARSFIRKNDLIARFGGDEFAAILPDTTVASSATLLQRFFEQVRSIAVPDAPEDVRVTCSAGYTEIAPDDTTESLVKRVDEALYEAKDSGRDCYRYRPPPSPAEAL